MLSRPDPSDHVVRAEVSARADARPLLFPLLAMAVLWTIIPALVHTAPPLDVVESALWGREWVVGTYKHPGMPSWFIEAGRWLHGGTIGWPVYAASQLFALATLGLTFLLARDLAGARVAIASVFALLGVEYFSWRSVEFNHTLAQMPFWVGAAWCAWRAVMRPALIWWLALGAMAALGLYAKLSNAVLLVVIAGWILSTARGRATLGTSGPWLGGLTFAVLLIPLVRWLTDSDFHAFEYASARGHEQSLAATLLFPVSALLQAAPVALALALAGFFNRNLVAPDATTPHSRDALSFLKTVTLLPLLLSVIIALFDGSGVRATWMAPAIPLLTVLLIVHFASRLNDTVLANLGKVALGMAVLIPLGYGLLSPYAGRYGWSPPLRVNWPQRDVSRALATAWTQETGKPLKIVAGAAWMAGLVALDHPDRPSILTEGQLKFSPWITPERLKRDGALAVWVEGRGAVGMPALDALIAGKPVKEVRIPFPRNKPGQDIVVKYAIIPPG